MAGKDGFKPNLDEPGGGNLLSLSKQSSPSHGDDSQKRLSFFPQGLQRLGFANADADFTGEQQRCRRGSSSSGDDDPTPPSFRARECFLPGLFSNKKTLFPQRDKITPAQK